jgi:hypothetical protein
MDSAVATAISSLITGVKTPAIETFAAVLVAVVPVTLALWGLRMGWRYIKNAVGIR